MKRRVLRACLLAYPRRLRSVEGDVILALALDLIDAGASAGSEAVGLLRGGVVCRLNLSARPWRAALERLGAPLAALFLAAMVLGVRHASGTVGQWPGWSWTAGLVGCLAAAVGLSWGRRTMAAGGALLIVGLCLLDAAGDLWGSGTRWWAATVDVLPALGPAALVLLVSAAVARRGATPWRRLSWIVAGGGLVVAFALALQWQTTTGTTLLVTSATLIVASVLRAVWTRDSTGRLASAVVLAAATPAAAWSIGAVASAAGSDLVLAGTYGSGLAMATLALALARSAVPRHAVR